jgi:hypothetical protein
VSSSRPAKLRESERRSGPQAAFVALLAASLLTCLGLLELGLRAFFVAPASLAAHYPLGQGIAGAELRLEQREYEVHLRYNRHGFRDEEIPPAKGAGELRILCLGDSFVEGVGVAVEDRFCDVAERELARRRGGPVVAINAGQMATGPIEYFHNLLDFGIALEPDLVVVAIFAGNDFMGGRRLLRSEREVSPRLPERPAWWASSYVARGLAQLLSSQTYLVRNLRGKGVWQAAFGVPVGRSLYLEKLSFLAVTPDELDAAAARMDPALVADFMAGRLNPTYFIQAVALTVVTLRGDEPPPRPYTERDVAGLVHLLERSRVLLAERGIELVVLVIPHVHETHRADHIAFLQALAIEPPPQLLQLPDLRRDLVAQLEATGLRVVDLTEALRTAAALPFHVMDGHFDELGHRIAADALLREIETTATAYPATPTR